MKIANNAKWKRSLFASVVAACAVALIATPAFAEYEAGMELFKQGKFVESAAEWQEVVTNSPDYAFGYSMLGACYYKLGKISEAITQYSKAVELDSSNAGYSMNLANVQMKAKRYGDVEKTLNRAESLMSGKNKTLMHRLRGLSRVQLSKYSQAAPDLEQANPAADHTVASSLGVACARLNDSACAIKAYGQALAMKPGDTNAMKALSKLHLENGRRTKSTSAYKQALTFANKWVAAAPSDANAHAAVGAAKLGAKDFNGAISAYRKQVDLEGSNCTAKLNLASAYTGAQNWSQALSAANGASSCNPRDYKALNQVAFAQLKLKQYDQALATADRALAIQDNGSSKSIKSAVAAAKNAIATNQQADADEAAYAALKAAADKAAAEEEARRKAYEIKTGGSGGGGGKKK